MYILHNNAIFLPDPSHGDELLVADGAYETLLLENAVFGLHVGLDVAALGGAIVALGAGVRLLTGV